MRVGLIGAGAVAELHSQAALRLPAVTVTAVCDLSEEVAARVAKPHAATVFTDHRALLDAAPVDAVIVNTPHWLHADMVCDAADRGVHVLVEKPMATTLADCDRMVAACENGRVRLAVGHIQHFLPDKTAARRIIESGDLGEPVLVHDYRSTDYRPGTRPDWFFSPQLAGGGALMNIGAHCIDRTTWLTGTGAYRVQAALATRFGVDVETDALVNLTLDGGLPATVTVCSTAPADIDEILVVCEHGSVSAGLWRGTTVNDRGTVRSLHTPTPADIPDAFAAQLRDFAACVRDGHQPEVPAAHGRAVLQVVLAAYRSARTGVPVDLNPSV